MENLIERAVILTRGRSLEAPIAELQKTKTEGLPPVDLPETKQVPGERTHSWSEKTAWLTNMQESSTTRWCAHSPNRGGAWAALTEPPLAWASIARLCWPE